MWTCLLKIQFKNINEYVAHHTAYYCICRLAFAIAFVLASPCLRSLRARISIVKVMPTEITWLILAYFRISLLFFCRFFSLVCLSPTDRPAGRPTNQPAAPRNATPCHCTMHTSVLFQYECPLKFCVPIWINALRSLNACFGVGRPNVICIST